MGRDKALLELPALRSAPWPAGVTLLEWTLRRLAELGLELLLARGDRPSPPSLGVNVTAVPDAEAAGPLAGILGAARARPAHSLLVLGVDLPWVPSDLLRVIADDRPDVDWLVPRHRGRYEPLCARYGVRALERLEEQRQRGRFDLRGLAAQTDLRTGILEAERLARFGRPDRLFLNLNRPTDLADLG